MNNLIAIEVKTINAQKEDIKKELLKLSALVNAIGYRRAFYLFYGNENANDIERIIGNINQLNDQADKINLSNIAFYFHGKYGQKAIPLEIVGSYYS